MSEFIHMITASFLIAILFLGGWHLWGITGTSKTEITWWLAILRVVVLMVKITAVILFFMLIRWTWPRFRFDQLMTLAWKVMLPLGIANLVAVAILSELLHPRLYGDQVRGWLGDWYGLVLCLIGWIVALLAWVVVALAAPAITDNRDRVGLSSLGTQKET
jgi:NADH-quinone oxidoreductase subunit H